MAWLSPTGETLNGWGGAGLAWDEDTGTRSDYDIPRKGNWSSYLVLPISEIQCDKVQVWSGREDSNVNNMEVDVYYSAGWHNIHTGSFQGDGAFYTFEIGSTQTVSSMRLRYYNSSVPSSRYAYVYEADFWEVPAGPTPGWNKLAFTSEPPTPNAWNQLKQTGSSGWIRIDYDGD